MSQDIDTGSAGTDSQRGGPARPGRMWTYLIVGAAVAFAAALILGSMRLFVNVTEVSDTPEHSVEQFLSALLEDRDAEAANAWLCDDMADRDLTDATDYLAERSGLEWSDVTEQRRSVGRAVVTAEVTAGGDDAVTWSFTLVAEDSDPQWLVCGLAVE